MTTLSPANKLHHELLEFLRDASKDNPMDLATAFHLRDESTRDTYYAAYIDLTKLKYIESNKYGFWLTTLGKQYLELVKAAAREKLKI